MAVEPQLRRRVTHEQERCGGLPTCSKTLGRSFSRSSCVVMSAAWRKAHCSGEFINIQVMVGYTQLCTMFCLKRSKVIYPGADSRALSLGVQAPTLKMHELPFIVSIRPNRNLSF